MTTSKEKSTAAKSDAADTYAEALKKGYFGTVPDPESNAKHSLASGPDSPALADDDRTRFAQPTADKES